MKNLNYKIILVHVASILLFMVVLKKFDALSVIYTSRTSMLTEAPLAIGIYYSFFIIFRAGRLRYLAAAVPVFMVYGVGEIYYRSFGAVFKFAAIKQLPDLMKVLTISQAIGILVGIFSPALLLLAVIDIRNKRKLAAGAFILSLILSSVVFMPSLFLSIIDAAGVKIVEHSDVENVQQNGRLTMALYWEAKRSSAIKKLHKIDYKADADDFVQTVLGYLENAESKPNVHLLVLESFFDPRLYTKVKFSVPPLHPDFVAIARGHQGFSLSPIFGGRSAQAEFEVLSGVPAFAEFDDIEFNVFGGGKASASLPSILAKSGYLTIATNAFKPQYFNSDIAYKGLGFDEVYYPKEYAPLRKTYFENGDLEGEGFIFDGKLLEKNAHFVLTKIKNSEGRPIFNYVLGLYGHYPYKTNETKRPPFIKASVPSGASKEIIERVANQIYYRSQAVAEYVKTLMTGNPESVILVVGDHLPNLEPITDLSEGYGIYKKLGYLTRRQNAYKYVSFYAIGKNVSIPSNEISHYNIMEIVLNCITGGRYCKEVNCFLDRKAYYQRYLSIMAMGVR